MNNRLKKTLYPIIFFAVILLIWEAISRLGMVPAFILPSPSMIIVSLVKNISNMSGHIFVTAAEALTGFSISIILSVIIAVTMDSISAFKKTVYPIIVISQTIPIIILAPLFVIWFGYGYMPKIIIVILICFFPVTISLLQSLNTVDKELIDMLRSMGATRLQLYRFVKIPSSMPGFFSGLKIAATYSIMGATIGEWVGGKNGLGVYMIRAKQSFATDKVFAAILVIVILSILILRIIELLEKKYIPWIKLQQQEVYIEEKI